MVADSRTDESNRGANVAEELLILGEELFEELKKISIEAPDVERLLHEAKKALLKGNIALATVKSTDACTLAEQRKNEGIIQIVGKKVTEIKDFLRSVPPEIDVSGVREYLARGEDALILGRYEEANKFLNTAIEQIGTISRDMSTQKVLALIARADNASQKKFILDPEGRLKGMLADCKKMLNMGDLDNASELAYEILNRCKEESKHGEIQSLWEEISSIELEIEQLEKLGAEVGALNIRIRDAKESLQEGDVGITRSILSNCYIIIKRLKGRVKIKAAQERLAKAKYVVDQIENIELDGTNSLKNLQEAKRLFDAKKYSESIKYSDAAINNTMEQKHSFYQEKIFLKIDELKENISQLESSGLQLDKQKRLLNEVADDATKKKYFECENMLENISLELLKEKNNLRITKGSSEISGIQVGIQKLKKFGLPTDQLTKVLEEAQKAFNEYNYHLIEELSEKAKELTDGMIREHQLVECKRDYKDIETRMTDMAEKGMDIRKAEEMLNEGRNALASGDYKLVNMKMDLVNGLLLDAWEEDMNKKIGEVKGTTVAILQELEERGIKTAKAEKLLELAELKIQAKEMDEGFLMVKDAYLSAEKMRKEFFRRKYLDTLLDYHTLIKALGRGGVDTSLLEKELKEAKMKVEKNDFEDLDELFNTIMNSITEKKQEYLGGISSQRFKDIKERVDEIEHEGVDVKEIMKIMDEAKALHANGEYDTERSILENAIAKAEGDYQKMKHSLVSDAIASISGEIPKLKEASIDTDPLENSLKAARTNLEAGNLERASEELMIAKEMSGKLLEKCCQERILDIISETKVAFRELMEAGLDMASLRTQLNTVKEHFGDQHYTEALDLGEDILDRIRGKKRFNVLNKKKQKLVKRYGELENEGLDLKEEWEQFSKAEELLVKDDFEGAEEILCNIDMVMEDKFHSYKKEYYSKEIKEFDDLLRKFSEKDIEVSNLYPIVDTTKLHLEKDEFEAVAECLKRGWKEAESARDFYVSNKLMSRLYDLEDALFELANKGANVKGLDGELLRIKKMISRGVFNEAREEIDRKQTEIESLEKEFYQNKVRMLLLDISRQMGNMDENGIDVSEMRTLVGTVERHVAENMLDEAYRVIENLKERRDQLELDFKVNNAEYRIKRVKKEIDSLEKKGIDTELMQDLYTDAKELLEKNNFSEVEAYCRLAMKEGEKRETEFDRKVARERVGRSKDVLEFIEKDSQGQFDLSTHYPLFKTLSSLIEEDINEEIQEKIIKFEDDVRNLSHEYMKQKAISTKRILEDIISEIDELGGVTSTFFAFIKKGDKLLDKEHFGPCIEWFQKGIEKAANEKRRQETRLSVENVQELLENVRKMGADVTQGGELLEQGKRAFKNEDFDKSWEMLDKARDTILKGKYNYQKAKINNLMITNNLIYDDMMKMKVPAAAIRAERELMDRGRESLEKDDLDDAEGYVKQAKEALTKAKNQHNLQKVRDEVARVSDICGSIEEQGVEISTSLQLLEDLRTDLKDRKSLPDEDYHTMLDEIKHAISTAREQESIFKLHLLDNNLERNEALLNKCEIEGVDISEPDALFQEARSLYDAGNTEDGLMKVNESMTLAKKKRSEFFKESADGLMYTADLLLKDILELPTDTSHLGSMLKASKEMYSNGKYRKCAHELRSFIGACDEVVLINNLQGRINELRETMEIFPIGDETFKTGFKKIEDMLVNREFDKAKDIYDDMSKRFGIKLQSYKFERAEEEVRRNRLKIHELSSDGIDQEKAGEMIGLCDRFVEQGELEKAQEMSERAVEVARKVREEKILEISEAIISLEGTFITGLDLRGFDESAVDELRGILKETKTASETDLTKMVMSFSRFLDEMNAYEINSLFLERTFEAKKRLESISRYLPEDVVGNIASELDKLPISGTGAIKTMDDEPFRKLNDIQKEMTDVSTGISNGVYEEAIALLKELGGDDVLRRKGIWGLDVFDLYDNKWMNTPDEDLPTKLNMANLLMDQSMNLEKRAKRKEYNDLFNSLSKRIDETKLASFSPTSAKQWLGEGMNSLKKDDFEEVERCFERTEDALEMAEKRHKQEMASQLISSAIKRMRAIGLKFSEAKDVQMVLRKAQHAEKKREYSQIEKLCKKAVDMAIQNVALKNDERYGAELERIEKAIRSEAREIDEKRHLAKLDIARRFYRNGRYSMARNIAKEAEKNMRDDYWNCMISKLNSKYREMTDTVEQAKAMDMDVSQAASFFEESRKMLMKDALALADDNVSEGIYMINEFILRRNIRDLQDEAAGWRKEIGEIEEKGGDVAEGKKKLERFMELLKKNNIKEARVLKEGIVKILGSLHKDRFRNEVGRTLEKCNLLLQEIETMKGDTIQANENIKKATDYLSGELLESAKEISENCLKDLKTQRNSLLEERASSVLYAAGEIVKGTENKTAKDYYLKARKAYELERYKEALRMARESMKHM